MSLNNFLKPKMVAILGASNDKSKVGRKILDNIMRESKILRSDKIFPINLKEKKIAGLRAYSDIGDLPINNYGDLLLIISIPAKFVLLELAKAQKLGVKNVVIISAGFKEIGGEGELLEKEITRIAKESNMNILGPNCLGFINVVDDLNISFSDYSPDKSIDRKNNIAFISQSGAIGSAVLNWLENKNIGLSYFVSIGNKAGLNENDFFDFFYNDKKSDLVIVYLEEISQGGRFLEIVSKISKVKPVAILKAGRTSAGSQMAMSHTGSLAGSNEAVITALKRSGAIIIENISQIYNLMRLVKGPLDINNNSLSIVSNAGGPSVLASDEAFEGNLSLSEFSLKTKKDLKNILPSFSHIKNPLDILGDADSQRYKSSLEIVLRDKNVSSVLILLTLQSMTDAENIASEIVNLKKKYNNKIIATCFLGGRGISKAKKILADGMVPNFDSVEESISTISKVLSYCHNRKSLKTYKDYSQNANSLPVSSKNVIDYIDSFKFFKMNDFDVVSTRKIDNKKLVNFKYPLVLKFVGPDFIHKSDKGGVFVNVKNQLELRRIINLFNADVKSKNISEDNYIVYQEMIKSDFELILGVKRDPVFGHLIMFGMGGIYAEVYKDVSFELLDLDKNRAIEMIKRIKSYPILNGARNGKKIDINALAGLILKFAKLIKDNLQISEVDLNPILVRDNKFMIADIRIIN